MVMRPLSLAGLGSRKNPTPLLAFLSVHILFVGCDDSDPRSGTRLNPDDSVDDGDSIGVGCLCVALQDPPRLLHTTG